jgi:hypothetical protein
VWNLLSLLLGRVLVSGWPVTRRAGGDERGYMYPQLQPTCKSQDRRGIRCEVRAHIVIEVTGRSRIREPGSLLVTRA